MVYRCGASVYYKKLKCKATVVNVHYDDIVPYYTIRIVHQSQNREIQTISEYLKPIIHKTRRRRRTNVHKKKTRKK